MVKIANNVENGQKWSKLTQNWSQIMKCLKSALQAWSGCSHRLFENRLFENRLCENRVSSIFRRHSEATANFVLTANFLLFEKADLFRLNATDLANRFLAKGSRTAHQKPQKAKSFLVPKIFFLSWKRPSFYVLAVQFGNFSLKNRLRQRKDVRTKFEVPR
jgi:hypothetical protein